MARRGRVAVVGLLAQRVQQPGPGPQGAVRGDAAALPLAASVGLARFYWRGFVAIGADGVRWRKHAANPLLEETHDERWDAVYLAEPNVIFDGSGFRMWYNGASANTETLLGYAYSTDGIEWTRFEGNRPVLTPGPDGAWDDFAVARASVLYDGEQYKLWYEGHDGRTWRIGTATSTDGVEWIPVGIDLEGTSHPWNTATVPGSTTARLRITANDGFNEIQGRFYAVGAEIARLEEAIQYARESRRQHEQDLAQAEKALQEADTAGKLEGGPFRATMTLEISGLGLTHTTEGEIAVE
mgnify:CR=1 FL=1